ncbi:MAG: hypothetical protein A2252_09515 [Elusimicrobia bacterium RIFOXYA2_FULL_39_19]|nr:MAG: hypothetical protein A2252_09515 [Elusimicrobia bacterium RIFOXYA2_FULL_39_19]
MKCKEARKLISPYIDNELNQGEKALVKKHVFGCSKCHYHYLMIKKTVFLVRSTRGSVSIIYSSTQLN